MAEVKKQINLMDSEDYFTDEQIATAVRKLSIERTMEKEVTSDFTQAMSFWWASSTIDYYVGYVDHLKKVTRADLQAYVRKYIKGQHYCAGLLINPDLKAEVHPEDFFTASN
jgi:zinc protease